ncbi:protein O-linked-mannose beta-1,4-N-acetylglucosaminyltransferase 2 [Platysternon megacephalum]|uniref:Protein O-linked-mannose beta-1,4-N-acetylglucosaminyltransferase 2 n=1 Tax=Platysternon megacephalum TaxID=55544 RepID=A0A4D9EMD3_9SAUR|nr:protein O-linked-mannose beta-1,4-N-acetylglucosaminyltransferase 2 [Platysternon megacephalum]
MSTKVPIYLKRGSRKGKKEKLRDILSSDMISPPLGDFRHTIHIGSGGENDMFGDISFLQGKFHLLPRTEGSLDSDRGSHCGVPFEFSRTATISGHEQPFSEAPSPLLKNAISLPVIGGPQALMLPSTQAPPKPPRLHLDDKVQPDLQGKEAVAELTSSKDSKTSEPIPHLCSPNELFAIPQNGFVEEENKDESFMSHAGSLLSLHVDLGPSILEDVLQVMDKHQAGKVIQDSGRQEILT